MNSKLLQVAAVSALLLGIAACNDDTFNPQDGSVNFPVQGALRKRYKGTRFVRNKDINTANFHVKTRPPMSLGDPTASATDPNKPTTDANGKPTDPTKKDSGAATNSGEEVQGHVTFKHRCMPDKDSAGPTTAVAPCKANEWLVTDVFFVPTASTENETPLKKGTEYCFYAEEVHQGEAVNGQKNNDKFQAAQTCFTTESDPSFAFVDQTSLNGKVITTPKGVYGDDIIAFKLRDPVIPETLKQGTKICQLDPANTSSGSAASSTDTKDPCRRVFGGKNSTEFPYTLYQIESLTQDPKSKFILVNYNMYGVKTDDLMGSKDANDQNIPVTYALTPDLNPGGGISATYPDKKFVVSINDSRFANYDRSTAKDPTLDPSISHLQKVIMELEHNTMDAPAIFALTENSSDTKKPEPAK